MERKEDRYKISFWHRLPFGGNVHGRSITVVLFLSFMSLLTLNMYADRKPEIVCFGDSITFGAKVDGHSWVYFLSKANPGLQFINEGRNGRKTSDREEIVPVLQKYTGADCFMIFLGVNDLKDGNDSMVNQCIANIRWMVDKVREKCGQAKIVILSPAGINPKTMSDENIKKKYNDNTERALSLLDKKYKDLSNQDSLGFVSLINAVSQENYVDGLHPNEAGQQQIAGEVWKGIKKLINAASS